MTTDRQPTADPRVIAADPGVQVEQKPTLALAPTTSVLMEIAGERDQQTVKWGEQNHPDGTNLGNAGWREHARELCQRAAKEGRVTWAHILQEEFVEALAEVDPEKLRAELVQVAAVTVAWIEAIDRRTLGGAE